MTFSLQIWDTMHKSHIQRISGISSSLAHHAILPLENLWFKGLLSVGFHLLTSEWALREQLCCTMAEFGHWFFSQIHKLPVLLCILNFSPHEQVLLTGNASLTLFMISAFCLAKTMGKESVTLVNLIWSAGCRYFLSLRISPALLAFSTSSEPIGTHPMPLSHSRSDL